MEPGQSEAALEMAKSLMKAMEQLQGSSKNVSGNMNDMTKALAEAFQNTSGMEDFFNKMDKSSKNFFKNLSKELEKNKNQVDDYQKALNKATEELAARYKKKYFFMFPIETLKKRFNAFKVEGELLRSAFKKDIRLGIIVTGEKIFSKITGDLKLLAKVGKFAFGLASSLLSGLLSIAINALDIFKNIVTTVYKLGEAFIMLPYKVLDKIGNAAHTIREEFMQIKQTYEETQQTIDGRSIEGRGLARITNQARALGAAFIDTTNIYTRIFGYGLQGQQGLISKTGERIAGLGTLSGIFAAEVEKSALAFEVYQQRLAMSAQDLQIAARFALAEQKSLGEVLENRRVQLNDIAAKYRLNSKMIATGFNELKSNIIEFGHLSDKALLDVTARAAQLGIEAKELNAVFNKFTTFDQAAESAALLSQTFGMAVDAMQIIKAEDPMQIVEQFRDSMMQTGRSFDDLNRHEKALMSQYTGLSGEALKTAMTFKGVGLSYEDLQKKMEETSPQGKMLSAIKEMTAAVKEFMAVGEKITNPFQAMIKGVEMGITKNTRFRDQLVSFSDVLQRIYTDTARVISKDDKFIGQLIKFTKTFQTAIEGPIGKGFITLVTKIMNLFDALLLAGPYASTTISLALKEIKDAVFDEEKGIGKLVNGMLEIGEAIVGNIIRGMINVLPGVLKIFNELIVGIGAVFVDSSSMVNTTDGFVKDYIIAPFQNVWPELKTLFGVIFHNIGTMFSMFTSTNVYKTIEEAVIGFAKKIYNKFEEALTGALSSLTPYLIAYLGIRVLGTLTTLAVQYKLAGNSLGSALGGGFVSSAMKTIGGFLSGPMGKILLGAGLLGGTAYMGYSAVQNFEAGNVGQGIGDTLIGLGGMAAMTGFGAPIAAMLAGGGLAMKAFDALSAPEKLDEENTQASNNQNNPNAVASSQEVKEFRRQLSNRDEMIANLQKERDDALYANNALERKISQRIPPIEIPIQLALNGTNLTDQILSTAIESRGQYQIGVRPNNSLFIAKRDGQAPDVGFANQA